jgi:hypothetical protein
MRGNTVFFDFINIFIDHNDTVHEKEEKIEQQKLETDEEQHTQNETEE